MTGNSDRATVHGFLQDGPELVLDFCGSHGGDVHKLAKAVSERELRHGDLARGIITNQARLYILAICWSRCAYSGRAVGEKTGHFRDPSCPNTAMSKNRF